MAENNGVDKPKVPSFFLDFEMGIPPEKTTQWAEGLRKLADKIDDTGARELTVGEAAQGLVVAGMVAGFSAGARGVDHQLVGNMMMFTAGLTGAAVVTEEVASRVTGKGGNIIDRPVVNPYTHETIPISSDVLPFVADALRWTAKAVDQSKPTVQIKLKK
jgi:hypothetical protein